MNSLNGMILCSKAPRYDASKLAFKIATKCTLKSSAGSKYFDWKALGRECGVCFNSVPENVSFFAGSLDSQLEHKQRNARKVREKVIVDESQEMEPESVQNNKTTDADQLSGAEKNLKQMI